MTRDLPACGAVPQPTVPPRTCSEMPDIYRYILLTLRQDILQRHVGTSMVDIRGYCEVQNTEHLVMLDRNVKWMHSYGKMLVSLWKDEHWLGGSDARVTNKCLWVNEILWLDGHGVVSRHRTCSSRRAVRVDTLFSTRTGVDILSTSKF